MNLLIHNIITHTSVNGPGIRYGLWLQGCNLNCPNCFNPETHSFNKGIEISIYSIFKKILKIINIEGVSISGGEPLLQANILYKLLRMIKEKTSLSILLFSGFNMEEIKQNYYRRKSIEYVDVLIAGRYMDNKKCKKSLISSSNQKIYLLTDRYDLADIGSQEFEIIIDNEGNILLTGFESITSN